MFISFEKIEQAAYPADHMQNPKHRGNDMILSMCRNKSRTAFFTVYFKKAFGEYWDTIENTRIARQMWTSEMHAFYKAKRIETPKPPFIFKMTIAGWLFTLGIMAFFIYLAYDSMKPPLPKSAEVMHMEKPIAIGDVFFGHFEAYKEKGDRVASNVGFGWFKISQVAGDTIYVAKSVEMNKGYKPKEQLNSTNFEAEGMPAFIKEKTAYTVRLIAVDTKTDFYFDSKK